MAQPKNRSVIRMLFYIILIMIVASACNLLPGGSTPEEAVRKTWPSPDYQVSLVRQVEAGAVVLYHKLQPEWIPGDPQNPSFQLGYSFVDRKDFRWGVRGGISGSFTPAQDSKVIFLLDQIQPGTQGPKIDPPDSSAFIVFGKVLDQTIETVEVSDEEGRKTADTVSDSMFMMIAPPGATPCELQFIDKNGDIIETYDLAALQEWQSSRELIEKIKRACID